MVGPVTAVPVVQAPLAPGAMADDYVVAVTSPRFTLDQAHRAAAVHDLLVYGLVGREVGWEREGLSKTTTRTRIEGNVEQLMGSENGKGKTKIVSAHKWVTEVVEALQDMHDEAGPFEADECWEWTIRNIGAAFLRLASTRSFHLSTVPETLPEHPTSGSSSSSSSGSTPTPRHRAVVRASKAVRLGRKNRYKILDSLDTVVIELQGHTFGELVESGLDGRKLVRTKEAGGWKLMLGPGSLMRRGCHTCFWTSGGDDNVPSFVFSTRLDWHLEQGQEVITQAGLALPLDQYQHPDHHKNRKIWPEEDDSAVHIEETEQLLVNCADAQAEIDRYRARPRQASTASTLSPDRSAASETPDALAPDPVAVVHHSSPTSPITSPIGASRSECSTPLSPGPSLPIDLLDSSLTSSPALPSFHSTDRPATATATTASVYSSPLSQTSDISSRPDLPDSPWSPHTPHTPIPVFAYDTSLTQKIATPVKDPTAMLSSNSQSYDSIPLSCGPREDTRSGGEKLEGNNSLGLQEGGAVGGMPCPMEMLGSPWMMVERPESGMISELNSQEQMSKAETAVMAVMAAEAPQGLDLLVGNDTEDDMDLDEFLESSSPARAAVNGPAPPGSPQATGGAVAHSGQLGLRDDAGEHISDGHEPGGLEAATGEQMEEGRGGSVQSPPHCSFPAPDSEPERKEEQDGLGASESRDPTSSELDDELLDELLEDFEMEEAPRACRSTTTETVDDDREMEQEVQGEKAGRGWVKHDKEDHTLGGGAICGPRGCDLQAQEGGPLAGDSREVLAKPAPPQVAIPFTPSPSIQSDDSPHFSDIQKTSRRRNGQNALKIRPSKHHMKTRGHPYKAAIDPAVLSGLKRSILRERSARETESTRHAEEGERREVAELRVAILEREKERWEGERAMLIREIKRPRGWDISEPIEDGEEHDGTGDGAEGTEGEVGIGLKRTKTRRYTVGDVPSFKPFMPVQTESLVVESMPGRASRAGGSGDT